jgi:hypothetical protein
MSAAEVADIRSFKDVQLDPTIKLVSTTISWPQNRFGGPSSTPSAASTPRSRFVISDLSLEFPDGELSLICGKLGKSGNAGPWDTLLKLSHFRLRENTVTSRFAW